MNTKHTPGPWRFTKINGKQPCIVNDATGGRITYIDDDVTESRASLIAAAPDLYKLAQDVADLAGIFPPEVCAVIDRAKALTGGDRRP